MPNRKAPATPTTRLRSSGRRYPGVQGKVVDYISHSIDDGTLCVNVCFTDRTLFSLRFRLRHFHHRGRHERLEDRKLRDDSRIHEADSTIEAVERTDLSAATT